MRAVGIVCEYNPFHKGHLYQIEALRQSVGEDVAVVCAMSGDFVQRGEAAVFDKFARAEAACKCGASLVLELPLPWCLSSAEGFARGAVGLLGAMGCEALCFGSESGELEGLEQLAELLLAPAFNESVRARLAREPNLSYAAARQLEAEAAIGEAVELLERPNDILAVEYLKAVRTLGLSMRPLPVLRKGSGHDRDAAQGEMRSASEIRRRMAAGASVEDDIPAAAYAVYARELGKGRAVLKTAALETAMLSRLLLLSAEDFASLPDAADGLGNRLYRAVRENGGLDAILTAAKTRRYALARIRRLCLCACLGVREGMAVGFPPYARVLAADGKGRAYLRQRSGEGEIPLVTRLAAVRALAADSAALFELGARAHDFYTLGFENRGGISPDEDWRTGPSIV